jgi:hypothetical protein
VVGADEVGKQVEDIQFHCYLRGRVCRETCLGMRWHAADLEAYMVASDAWAPLLGEPTVVQLPGKGIYANTTAITSAALHEVRCVCLRVCSTPAVWRRTVWASTHIRCSPHPMQRAVLMQRRMFLTAVCPLLHV